MNKRSKQVPPAVVHGAYSGTTLLPGEDPAAFKKLYETLIDDFVPKGPLEDDIVRTIAHLIWRKRNLATYRSAKRTKDETYAFTLRIGPPPGSLNPEIEAARTAERQAYAEAVEERARKDVKESSDEGYDETIEDLLEEWSVIDRLDGMIDRCLKRLLMVRGVKSMSPSVSEASSPPRKRLNSA